MSENVLTIRRKSPTEFGTPNQWWDGGKNRNRSQLIRGVSLVRSTVSEAELLRFFPILSMRWMKNPQNFVIKLQNLDHQCRKRKPS
jgi:hypothetical protein